MARRRASAYHKRMDKPRNVTAEDIRAMKGEVLDAAVILFILARSDPHDLDGVADDVAGALLAFSPTFSTGAGKRRFSGV